MPVETFEPEPEIRENDIPHEEASLAPPQNIRTTRRIGDRLYVGGEGPRPARVMFIATTVLEEEAAETQRAVYGRQIRQKPRYLKGAPGSIFKDILGSVGIDIRECYYTALVKWLNPIKAHRTKPKKEDLAWATPSLFNEIKEVKPEIIVCLGKAVFDLLNETGVKLALQDIAGAWFRSDRFNCRVFPMDDITKPVFKPEYVEKNRVELLEVKKMLDKIDGVSVVDVVQNYRTVENYSQLLDMVSMWDAHKLTTQSVDCEWGGSNHVSGKLRSIQFCWDNGHAAYVKFRDEKGQYAFDVDYRQAGELMGCWLNREEVKYVGHHFAADAPWMHKWLGLEWYDKCIFDTEFGQQCADEFEDLGLERMAIRYTSLGRYDLPLMLWLKANKQDPDAGYAFIPDHIIIPYGCADVDTVFRAYPVLLKELTRQKLLDYYYGIFLPMVTNIFTQFALMGFPMNIAQMDELRDLFSYAREHMEINLRIHITEESETMLMTELMKLDTTNGVLVFSTIKDLLAAGKPDEAFNAFKAFVGITGLKDTQCFFDHRVSAPNFNIRSVTDMRRWLFDVKRLQPIKTTNNKEKGLPSMPWVKVLDLPPERQKEYQPSTDKQSLQILGESDPLIGELLELNAVGNLCKAFLKEPTVDEDTGEITRENGLHYWLCDDGCIHGQMSTTETGRPRAWKPNVLNWPSFVNKKISDGIEKLMKRLHAESKLPPRFERYITEGVPSIRSCVDASSLPPLPGSKGWCFVESDYQTAEVRGLAYISGDPNMIKMFEEPDTQFAMLRTGNSGNEEDDFASIRMSYAPDCGIKLEGQDARVIGRHVTRRKTSDLHKDKQIPEGMEPMEFAFKVLQELVNAGVAIPVDKKEYFFLAPVDMNALEKNEDGSLRSPKFDFHWNLAEMVNHKPREFMQKKVERGAGKVGNFCIAEGELVLTRRGLIPIEQVLACDSLWDGTDWVSHEGVISKGEAVVHYYGGLWATDNHTVWLEDGTRTKFGQARMECARLARTSTARGEAVRVGFEDISRDRPEERKGILFRYDRMPALRRSQGKGIAEYGERFFVQMPVSESASLQRSQGEIAGGAFRGDAAALQSRHACVLSQLQGPGNHGDVQDAERLRNLGIAEMAKRNLQREGLRPTGQQRALLEAESSTCIENRKSDKSERHTVGSYRTRTSVHGEVSRGAVYREDMPGTAAMRIDPPGNSGAAHGQPMCWSKKARIYDIVNAGPKHRFTCSGVLVSNSSAYGATPDTLERKIEADTGTKPPPGTGQALLDALEKRQPVAMNFLKSMETIPKDPGFYRAASGRIRHFYLHPDHMYNISSRSQRGVLSALGRECRNFPFQNSVADTSARAGNDCLKFAKEFHLAGRPMVILYDSVVTLCPVEERFIWEAAHDLFMRAKTGWKYADRILRYPIDTEYNCAWSAKPSKEWKKNLYDRAWAPTKPEHLPIIEYLKSEIAKYDADPMRSVWNKS